MPATRSSSPSSSRPMLVRLAQHGALAGELRDEDALLVADARRIDVLEGLRGGLDGGHVQAALVRERGASHVGLVAPGATLTTSATKCAVSVSRSSCSSLITGRPILSTSAGMMLTQVGVAAALAVAVDRALDLAGAGVDGDEAVGDGAVAVVVDVHADGGRRGRRDLGVHVGHERRQRRRRWCRTGRPPRRPLRRRRSRSAGRSPRRRARRRRSARRRRRRACPARRGSAPTRRSCAGSRRGSRAAPCSGAGPRSCRRWRPWA